jgi:hypothetical protein
MPEKMYLCSLEKELRNEIRMSGMNEKQTSK